MKIRTIVFMFLAAALLCAGRPLSAEVIFDNGVDVDDTEGGLGSDFSGESFGRAVQRADDFQLAPGATTINVVSWLGFYAGFGTDDDAVDNFTIQIFEDSAGPQMMPLWDLQQGTDFTLATAAIEDDYTEFTATGLNITLAAGTTYWLSVAADTTGDADDFFWGAIFDVGNGHERFGTGDDWDQDSSVLAFTLEGGSVSAVPEPSSLALLLVGGLGLVVGSRWRRL